MIDRGGHLDRQRLALACADVGFFEVDAVDHVVRLDDRASELVGVKTSGAIGLDEYLSALDPDHRDRVAGQVAAAAGAAGEPYHDEFRTRSRRWVAADGRALHDGAERRVVLVGLLCDVTLRRTTEDARSRLVDEMARALRFNDMLVGLIAHDLRSPLHTVVVAAELVARQRPGPVVEDAMGRVIGSADRMQRIVAQLRDLTHARLDGRIPLAAAPTSLSSIMTKVAHELTASRPEASIEIDVRGDTTCTCDAERIAEVLANLLGNAARHGSDPRRVRAVADGRDPAIVTVTVTNPGTIAPELIPVLFNPFRRARSDHGRRERSHGLGLGLYIARRIVLGHGGDLTVTSSDERGTAFCAVIPRAGTPSSFSLTPDQGDEEAISLQRLGIAEPDNPVTASLFGVLPLQERAPDAFTSIVERHARLLELSLDRQIYRDARVNLTSELRALADQLGRMGAGANDVAALHAVALQRTLRGAAPLKAQALVGEGRLLALELMGRLLTFYRRRSGFGAATAGDASRED
jgi:signal transduction histidine kinase